MKILKFIGTCCKAAFLWFDRLYRLVKILYTLGGACIIALVLYYGANHPSIRDIFSSKENRQREPTDTLVPYRRPISHVQPLRKNNVEKPTSDCNQISLPTSLADEMKLGILKGYIVKGQFFDVSNVNWLSLRMDEQYKLLAQYQQAYAVYYKRQLILRVPLNLANNARPMELILVPPIRMEVNSLDDEVIDHPAFYIASLEITQAQWVEVIGENPSFYQGYNLPVTNISWQQASKFCEELNNLCVLPGGYFDLPTCAEYRILAGCRRERLDQIAWFAESSTQPVGIKSANLGIYDLIGNVAEWASDANPGNAHWYCGGSIADVKQSLFWNPQLALDNESSPAIGFRVVYRLTNQ